MTNPIDTEALSVLQRGYCVLYLLPDRDRAGAGVTYRTWSFLIDRGWIAHQKSNLGATHPWERYRVTRAGKRALAAMEDSK